MNGALGAGAFVAGAVLLTATLACCAAAATLVVRRRLPQLEGAVQACAIVLLTMCALILAHLVPLALTILTRGTAVATAALLLAAASRVPAGPRADDGSPGAPAEKPSLTTAFAAVAVLAITGYVLDALRHKLGVAITSVDSLDYHLPSVIRYVQTGSLWHTTQYLATGTQGNYPQFGELFQLAVVLPWRSLAFVRYVDPVMLGVTGLALYAIGRELGAGVAASAIAASVCLASNAALEPALDVLTDPVLLASLALGLLFLMRHWRTGVRGELVLAGLGLGIAFGTKWYGAPMIPGLIAVWLVVGLASGRGRGRSLRDLGVLVGAAAVPGCVWLVRNLVLAANPVFNVKVSLLGLTIFDAPPDETRSRIGYSIAHYATDGHALRTYIWPGWRGEYWLAGGIVVLAAILAVAVWVRRRGDARILVLALGALIIAVAYALTPYSAQGIEGAPTFTGINARYGMPAFVVAAPLLAWLITRLPRTAQAVAAAGLALAVGVSSRHFLHPGGKGAVAAAVVVAAVAACAIVLRRNRLATVALAVVVAVGVAGASFHYQRSLAASSSWRTDPIFGPVLAAGGHQRVGVTGLWTVQGLVPPTPLFGPRLHNKVDYVGRFKKHLLVQYDREADFAEALRRGRYDFLVVGTGFPPRPHPNEEVWARHAGFATVKATPSLILMRAGS